MIDVRLLQLLQIADSAFPSGAFAHSFGLETAVVAGRVIDEATTAAWLRAYLCDALGPSDGAAMGLSMRGAVAARELDETLFALTAAAEVRAAQARIGGALADAYRTLGLEPDPAIRHPALQTAAAMRALGIEPSLAISAYCSSVLAALGAVAARVVPLGQRSVQRSLWALRPVVAQTAEAALAVRSREELGAWAVEPEIDALRHRLLDARVFAS